MVGPLGTTIALQPVVVQLTGDVANLLLDPTRPELAFFAAWTVHDRYGAEAQAIVERATDLIETIPDETLRRTLDPLHPRDAPREAPIVGSRWAPRAGDGPRADHPVGSLIPHP